VTALTACKVSVDYSGTSYQCPDGVTCPPGYTCQNMVCVLDPLDAGTGPDSIGGGDGAVPRSCGHASAIADDFDGQISWAVMESADGATVETSGGRAVLTLPANATGSPEATIHSHMRFDVRGDSVTLDMPQMVNTSTDAAAEIVLTATWRDYVEFYQQNGTLWLKSWAGGSQQTAISLPYNPTAHRWIRYREDGGTLYWETSPDGETWNTQHTIQTPDYIARSNLWISVYTSSGEIDSGALEVESVNGGGTPSQGWCPATDFTDDFDDNDRGLDWNYWDTNCVAAIQSGRVRFAPDSDLTADCGFELTTAWDLRGESIHIEIPQVVTATDATTYFSITDYNGSQASFNIQNGGLGLWLCDPNCSMSAITYSPTDHRWLRYRDDGGELLFETSPDGTNWTERLRRTPGFGLGQISVTMGVAAPTASSAPGETLIDNYNVVP
jgi:hypothetical protein